MPVNMIKILETNLKIANDEGDWVSAQNIRAALDAYKRRAAREEPKELYWCECDPHGDNVKCDRPCTRPRDTSR